MSCLQVDKILLATKELALEKNKTQERPHATQFIAGVGKETVKFDPVVRLNGKAEAYLLALLKAQIFTLSKCLASSVVGYPQMSRTLWIMQKDNKGDSIDPAQIVLLVAQINFVKQVY